jgi:hypothetical protein
MAKALEAMKIEVIASYPAPGPRTGRPSFSDRPPAEVRATHIEACWAPQYVEAAMGQLTPFYARTL